MEKIFLNSNTFDVKLVIECLNAFSKSTGLGCTVSSMNGEVMLEAGFGCGRCPLCMEASAEREDCTKAHERGMLEAERFGGKYVYFCMMGLGFFVSPISGPLGSIAKMIAGPFLMTDLDDYISYDLQTCWGMDKDAVMRLMPVLEKIPYIQPDRVHFLSSLLFMAVSFINNIAAASQMLDDQDSESIQRQVSDYIIRLKNETDQREYPFATERELLSSILELNKGRAHKLLNELLGHILFSLGYDFSRVKTRIYELYVLLSRAAIDAGAAPDYVFDLSHKFFTESQSIGNIENLCFTLTKAMNRLIDCVFPLTDFKNSDVINKAMQFIQRNYSRKISLDEVAREVDLSPSYFSKIFKHEIGYNFNTYMNIVRTGKSIKLLLYENINLVDIANMVGFEDQSYFTKVFKRMTGVSPHSFRKSGGRIQGGKVVMQWQKQGCGTLAQMSDIARRNMKKEAGEVVAL